MKVHCIKILPEYFEQVIAGVKLFELRKNDRDYCVNDVLVMKEWGNGKYLGRKVTVRVTSLLENTEGLEKGYCIMGTKIIWNKIKVINILSTFGCG